MQVRVQDVNEYVPAWEEEEYSGEVGEGEMRDPILTLTARDSDCSPTFGSVCSYAITREDAIIMLVLEIERTLYTCSTTGKPTRSFATERVSLDSV